MKNTIYRLKEMIADLIVMCFRNNMLKISIFGQQSDFLGTPNDNSLQIIFTKPPWMTTVEAKWENHSIALKLVVRALVRDIYCRSEIHMKCLT